MLDYKNTAFPEEEYSDRLSRVQKSMESKGLDLLLIHEMGNITWLCGVQCLCWNKYFCLVIPRTGPVKLIIESFEVYNAYLNTYLQGESIRPYTSFEIGKPNENPLEASVSVALDMSRSGDSVGLELETACIGLSPAQFETLRSGLSGRHVVSASGLVERVRAVKSPLELGYMRQAAGISSNAMTAVMDAARSGMKDNDLAAIAHEVIARGGGEYMCLDPIITIGSRSGVPHTTYARHTINAGDTGLLEFGACINRYTGVIMRSVSFGPPGKNVAFMAEGCISSVNAIIEHARPGALSHDVALNAKARLGEHMKSFMWHGIYGYSIGLGYPPRWDDCGEVFIMENNPTILEPGMVFHVSTTLRDLGRHSITVSETVAINETGCEVLTTAPRQLFIKQ